MSRFLLLVLVAALSACAPDEERMNLLLVTFDTTRADALSVYGNEKISMPAVERLASEGVVFERAYASVPITLPSHSTMMTGLQPFNHGARDNGVYVLAPEKLTLAEILKENGWATGAAVASFPLTRQFGIDQGFDFFDDEVESLSPATDEPIEDLFFAERPAGRVNASILTWLQGAAEDPFFLWVHYFDPHQPLNPPAPFDEMYSDLYFGEIAYADENLGVLLNELDRLGVADRTVVVLAGDHGEGRGQHREDTHSLVVYDATLHVPMIVKIPGGPGGHRVSTPVGLVDLFPTMLELLGLEPDEKIDGRSLASVIESADPSLEPLPLYAETMSPRINYGWGELRSLRTDGMKYIHGPRPELFDVRNDPEELHDLTTEQAATADLMRERLRAFLNKNATAGPSEQQEIDAETLAKLEALGYLQGDADDSVIEEFLNEGGVPPQDKVHLVSKHSSVRSYLFSESYQQAREQALALLEEDPGNPLYLRMAATSEIRLGLYDEATDRLVGLLGSDIPKSARSQALFGLSVIDLSPTRALRMIGAVEKSEALAPTAIGQYVMARCLQRLGRFDEREKALRRALVLDPGHLTSMVDLGLSLVAGHNEAEGLQLLEKAARIAPFNPQAWLALGYAQQRGGDPQGARRSLERAHELKPDNLDTARALLSVYIAIDRESEARELLRAIRQLTGGDAPDFEKLVEKRWSKK